MPSAIDITDQILGWVREWETAPEARWRWLNDPHNAIGIPATFSARATG
jgi:hypothetical protein